MRSGICTSVAQRWLHPWGEGWALQGRAQLSAARGTLNARACHGPDGRTFQDSRHMPAAFRPDHYVWIYTERNRFRVTCHVEHHLNVIEIGEHKFPTAFQRPKSKLRPKFQKALL